MEKFHKTVKIDGKDRKITFTRAENIPFGVVRKLRKETNTEQMFGMLEAAADEKSLEVLDLLTQKQVADIIAEWQGVDPETGEALPEEDQTGK